MAKKIVEIISYYDYDIDGSRLFNDVIRESSNLLDGFKLLNMKMPMQVFIS